jgi:hypothetical protein
MERKPEVVHVALDMSNGGVFVMQFVTREYPQQVGLNGEMSEGWTREATAENIEAEIAKTAQSWNGLTVNRWKIIDKANYQAADREFRKAWKYDDAKDIDVDIAKAREVWKDKIREARKPLLEALDTEYMRADEMGDVAKKATIAAKKRALRDATKAAGIAAAASVEDLKQVWPLEV